MSKTDFRADFPEVGYTPANLRHLLDVAGYTQKQAADTLGTTLRSVQNWAAEEASPMHRAMPAAKWRALFRHAEKALQK